MHQIGSNLDLVFPVCTGYKTVASASTIMTFLPLLPIPRAKCLLCRSSHQILNHHQFTVIFWWNFSDAEHKLKTLHRGSPSWKVTLVFVIHSAVIQYIEPKGGRGGNHIYILYLLFVVAFKSIQKSLICSYQKNQGPIQVIPNSDNYEHLWNLFQPFLLSRESFSREHETWNSLTFSAIVRTVLRAFVSTGTYP